MSPQARCQGSAPARAGAGQRPAATIELGTGPNPWQAGARGHAIGGRQLRTAPVFISMRMWLERADCEQRAKLWAADCDGQIGQIAIGGR